MTGKALQILDEYYKVDITGITTSEQLKTVWNATVPNGCAYVYAGMLIFDFSMDPNAILPMTYGQSKATWESGQHNYDPCFTLLKWLPPPTARRSTPAPATAALPTVRTTGARRAAQVAIDLQDNSDSQGDGGLFAAASLSEDEEDLSNVPSSSKADQAPARSVPKNGRLLAARGGVKKH